MIIIGDILVDEDILRNEFACKLSACKGACCVEGDSGAPLDQEECLILDEIYPAVKPLLSEKSKAAIREQGKWVEEYDGEYETPLVDGKECAYVIFENGLALCAIEKAWQLGKVDWPKPISCHLYPIRVQRMRGSHMMSLHYNEWDICAPACAHGKETGVPVWKFLKAPLIRAYGEEWYANLEAIVEARKGMDQ